MTGSARRLVQAIGLVVVIGGCGAAPPGPSDSLEPSRSIGPDEPSEADAALEAFLDAMADPDVTYRVNGQLKVLPIDEHNQAAMDIRTRYDVKGDDYAGSAYLAGWDRPRSVGGGVSIAVMDGTVQVMTGMDFEHPVEVSPSPLMRRPTTLQELTAADLEFVGVDADGLFEFAIERWVHGDPIGEWSDLEVVPALDFPVTTVRSHDTRLFLEPSGTPRRLVTTWSFDATDPVGDGNGTIVEEIEGLGMYVTFADPMGPLMTTSHDVIVGTDANHQAITEPWREVRPAAGDTAILNVEVEFGQTDQPIMLGIEGAILFVRSHGADGAVILDRIIGLSGSSEVDIGVGEQALVVYYRTCGGHCGRLDPPTDFCTVDADIEPGGRYRLLVEVQSRDRATCTLSDPSEG